MKRSLPVIISLLVLLSVMLAGSTGVFTIHVYGDGSIDASGVISGLYPGMYRYGDTNGSIGLVIHNDYFVLNISGTGLLSGVYLQGLRLVMVFARSVPHKDTCIDRINGSLIVYLGNDSLVSASYRLVSTTNTSSLVTEMNGSVILNGVGDGVRYIMYIVNYTAEDLSSMLSSSNVEGIVFKEYRATWINGSAVKILFDIELNYTLLFDIPLSKTAFITGMNIPWNGSLTYTLQRTGTNDTGIEHYSLNMRVYKDINSFILALHGFLAACITTKTIIIYNNIPTIITDNIGLLGSIGRNLLILPSNSTIRYSIGPDGYMTIWFKTPRFKSLTGKNPEAALKALYNIVMILVHEQKGGSNKTCNPMVKLEVVSGPYIPEINGTLLGPTATIPFKMLPKLGFLTTSTTQTTTHRTTTTSNEQHTSTANTTTTPLQRGNNYAVIVFASAIIIAVIIAALILRLKYGRSS